MAYRSEIIRALEELIANEGGDLFQSIATLHATQKWTQLVACERKWDGGLDAHPDGATQPGGIGIGLACSITPTIKKIKRDARETKKHYPDVKVLIFSTATKVSQHEKQKWAKEILDEFGLQLIVVSRAEFINWLLDPARAEICRDQLGILPPMPTELESKLNAESFSPPRLMRLLVTSSIHQATPSWHSRTRRETKQRSNWGTSRTSLTPARSVLLPRSAALNWNCS